MGAHTAEWWLAIGVGLWGETAATGDPLSTLSRVGTWRGMEEAVNVISGWSPLDTIQPRSLSSDLIQSESKPSCVP